MTPDRMIAVDKTGAAALFSLSRGTWDRMHRAGKCPPPILVMKSIRWDVADLRAWSAAGCPNRTTWKKRRRWLDS